MSSLINMIVAAVHGLFYDESKYHNRDIYEVKTRKIISYSNAIASASNIIYVAVSAYLGNERALNKLDVGGYVGKNGNLIIIKDLGLKDPYVGQVPIFSGEIAEDLAYYFTVSEQTPSAVALGVLVNTDYSIKSAGGFIVQMMPGADELLADVITYRLEEIPSITTLLDEGKTIKEIIEYIFDGMDLKILEEVEPEFKCNCSREKVEKALISIGEKDLKEIAAEGKDEELKCHFCNASYIFTKEDIEKILQK